MSALILHHYDLSPYAEKIRLCLGRKGLSWRSVRQPMVMPKPDLVELTGGYRRVPVLQVGADIWCDTFAIAPALDRLHPSVPLAPPGREVEALALSRWAETSFLMVVIAYFGIGGVFPEEFVEDRRRTMVPPDMNLDAAPAILPTKLVQLRENLAGLERILSDGRPFLMGDEPGIADFSAYHPILLMGLHERTRALVSEVPGVQAWTGRVREVGHGERSELEPAEAIAIAREAEPTPFEGEPVLPDGMKVGTPVVVLPDEYGSGNVTGTLEASGLHEIAVRRSTERAGEVVVHFPRATYGVIATG